MTNKQFWRNIERWDAATPEQRARAVRVLLGREFDPADCGTSTESMGSQALADLIAEFPETEVLAALETETPWKH